MLISIVIPVLNEEKNLEKTLDSVSNQDGPLEIIVVDGGSTDASVEIADAYAKVLVSGCGRALQMNTGAAEARGEILLFLHADTLLPERAFETIRNRMSGLDASKAGTFQLEFDSPSRLLGFYCWCTRFPHPSVSFGDRGLFVRRSVFEAQGGFNEIPLFEDVDLARRLYILGGFTFLNLTVTTAARRFDAGGHIQHQIKNLLLWAGYFLGIRPAVLARFYSYRLC